MRRGKVNMAACVDGQKQWQVWSWGLKERYVVKGAGR